MRIHELLEDASAGTSASGSIATVVNPHITNPYRSGAKKPKQVKPKLQKPTDNALDMNASLFGGSVLKR